MAVAREAKIQCQTADIRLAGAQPRQRGSHPHLQQILVNRHAHLGAEHVRQVKGRDAQRRCEISDAVRSTWHGRDPLLRRGREPALRRLLA
jgi:hypothetical protein